MARFKGNYPSSGNYYRIPSLRVPTFSGAFLIHDEVPESADFDLLLTFQRLFHDFKYLRYDFRRFFGPQTDLPLNNFYKVHFRHNAPSKMRLDKAGPPFLENHEFLKKDPSAIPPFS
jgi:hypothetical protein